MNAEAQRLLAEALALPENDRADLAAELLESLDVLRDEDADVAWTKEIAVRVQALDAGSVNTIPWAEVRRSILGGRDGSR
jgi:putative addiction module component (TIGR02574 family)